MSQSMISGSSGTTWPAGTAGPATGSFRMSCAPIPRWRVSEREARHRRLPVRVAKLPMRNFLRTQTTDETAGFMKVVVAATDDRILGFTMIGSEAGEVVATIQTAMLAELL